MFLKNANIGSGLFICKSYFPISMNLPSSLTHLKLACNFSSESEFNTKLTPFPFVAAKTFSSKSVSRELNI